MNNMQILEKYKELSVYGLILELEKNNGTEINTRVAAYNLLKAGRIIAKKSVSKTLGYLPDIAFDLSRHESVYRIAAFLYIDLGEKQKALECVSYLHYYYKDHETEPHAQYNLILQQLINAFENESEINVYIDNGEKEYQEQKILNIIKDYPEFLSETDITDQATYFSKIYRRLGINAVFASIISDVRFNSRQKAILLIRASRAVATISDEGPSIESLFANRALELDTSDSVIKNSYQAYLRAGDLNKLTQLKEQYPELL
ncbi:hypothetical protein [Psychrobacter sp. NPDC078501]|uniref:hypothetical protein n=1 Tax=Psychrobacter sp. NPDC078501 TaxID=3364495 RepID=UPI00384AE568